jgi:hypothetical protein
LYDENGNIYPAIPFPLGWAHLPRDVHQKFYEWQISEARRWGFEKIFLIGQTLSEGLYLQNTPYHPLIIPQAKEHYIEEIQEEAFFLARFAHEEEVDFLDVVNLAIIPEMVRDERKLAVSSITSLLPKLREVFDKKLTIPTALYISHLTTGFEPVEYNYRGFDYITPICSYQHLNPSIDSPEKLGSIINRYFDLMEDLARRENTQIIPVWAASFQLDNQELGEQIIRMFGNYENARIWLLKSILDKSLENNVAGVEIYGLWYHSRLFGPHGPYADQFSVWQSKRPLNTVASYFSHPWNNEGRETLRVLQHAALATNFTASYNQEFARWAEGMLLESLKAYRNGDYTSANSIASEILGKMSGVENPLGIRIDGDGSEWSADPIYFNASKQLPPLKLLAGDSIPIGGDNALIIENMRSLKAVYAVNDRENLYLMLEFYGPPPTNDFKHGGRGPFISIDTSGEWIHQQGKEYQIVLDPHNPILMSQEYRGREWTGHPLHDLRDVAYGNVVEVKIPLEYIGDPGKVNLLVWYPTMAGWGGMEVGIISWYKDHR